MLGWCLRGGLLVIKVLAILLSSLMVACGTDNPDNEAKPMNLGESGWPGYATVYAPYADAFSARLTEEGIPHERYTDRGGMHVVDWDRRYSPQVVPIRCEVIPRPLPSFRALAFNSSEELAVFTQGLSSAGVKYELAERRGDTFVVWSRGNHGAVQRIHTELFGSGLPNLRDEVHEERLRQLDLCERND